MNDEVPPSEENKIPLFLKITYLVVLIWGIWGFVAYWNGASGFFNRPVWTRLQEAADTTYPFEQPNTDLKESAA